VHYGGYLSSSNYGVELDLMALPVKWSGFYFGVLFASVHSRLPTGGGRANTKDTR
jgi:hypothetical protein